MKTRLIWTLLSAICFFSCDDNTGNIGMGMLPEGDQVAVKTITYPVTTRSILVPENEVGKGGAVFAKTDIGYLGRFTDPQFGYYEAGFLAQLNCTDSLTFPQVYDRETKTGSMTGDSIYLAELVLFYDKSYFGDPLNPCHLSVYELNKTLNKENYKYYTDIDPTDFYDTENPEALLAQKAYTAEDLSISEDDRNSSTFQPYIRIPLPKEVGERIYRSNREHPEYFYHSDDFIENVLKGIYVKNNLGDGTVIYINEIDLRVIYPCFELDTLGNVVKNSANKDSVNYVMRSFVSTKEVIQANQFKNSEKMLEKAQEENCTYIKAPAGIFTEVTLPIQQMADERGNDTLNYVKLAFQAYAQDQSSDYSMDVPGTLLLVRAKEYKEFFEKNLLPDNTTSFYTRHSSSSNQYVFNNITRLINTCITEKKEAQAEAGSNWNEQEWKEKNQWDKVYLVPVTITSETSDNQEVLISVHNDLKPSYVKLKGGEGEENKLHVEVAYTQFAE